MKHQKILKHLREQFRKENNHRYVAPKLKKKAQEINFADVMSDVRRIHCDRVEFNVSKPMIKVKVHKEERLYDYFYIGDVFNEPPKKYYQQGQKERVYKLLNGYYFVNGVLDLHGMQMEGLDELLTEFCCYIQEHGICGRIVHGSGLGSKGNIPVLKNHVRQWLYEYPDVLAYTEEKNNDGAVLILLKRRGD